MVTARIQTRAITSAAWLFAWRRSAGAALVTSATAVNVGVTVSCEALPTSATGTVAYLDMDARDAGKILAAAADTLDFGQPVAVMLIAILHLIPDGDDPWKLVADLMAATAPGSYLAITHPASDVTPDASARASRAYNHNVATPQIRRSRDEVARFFSGLELVEPGLVQLADWRPAPGDLPAPTSGYGAVARKP